MPRIIGTALLVMVSLTGAIACGSHGERPPPAGSVDSDGGGPGGDGAAGPTSDPDVALGAIISAADSSEWELETEVTMAPNGRDAFATWMIGSLGFRYNVGYSRSSDGGATWSAPHRVPTVPDIGVNAAVTSDAKGTFQLTWLENPPSGQRRVMAAHYVPASDVFTLPIEVSDAAAPAANDKPWIAALGDGSLLIAYGTDSGTSLVAAKSTDDGVTWKRTTIAPNASLRNVVFPCSSGPRVHIAYLVPAGVELVTSEDHGTTFGAPLRVDAPTSSGTAFEPPSCVADGNDVWITYGVGGGNGSTAMMALLDGIVVAHSSDAGRTIAARVTVTDAREGRHFLLPRLGRTGAGTLALGYYAGATAGGAGRFRVAFSDRGDTWTALTVKKPVTLQPSRTGFDSLGDYVGMHALGDGARGVLVSFADNASVPGASLSHIRMARVIAP